MHVLVPFAGVLSDAGRKTSGQLQLPNLQRLLQRLSPPLASDTDTADALSLSPPHERAHAQALGWPVVDGLLPWAARLAAGDGLQPVAGSAWGLVTPVHWHVGTDQVSLINPEQLMLDDAGSRALFAAVRDLFEGLGITLHYGHATRWYASHELLAELPCASLDRVIGRNVDAWLGVAAGHAAKATIRRLQAEVQMLLYTHPLNDERQARGLLPVNSFWLSACGRMLSEAPTATDLQLDNRLREPALSENWPAWAQAWQTLDEGPVAALLQAVSSGTPVQLTLCGERSAVTFKAGHMGWLQALRQRFQAQPVASVLESL